MTLKDWLSWQKLSIASFGLAIGVSRPTAYRIVRGAVLPQRRTLQMIERVTDGAVTATDIVRGLR